MKADGIKPTEAKPPAQPSEKPKTEKSAFDKMLRNKHEEIPGEAGIQTAAIPNFQMAPVMKKDETPGPASTRLIDNLSAEITTTLNTQDIKEVEIQFDSKTLAGLQVRIKSEEGKLIVRMQAGNADVAQLLERNSTGLVERLAAKGYAGAEIRVERSSAPARATQAKPPQSTPAAPAFKRGPR